MNKNNLWNSHNFVFVEKGKKTRCDRKLHAMPKTIQEGILIYYDQIWYNVKILMLDKKKTFAFAKKFESVIDFLKIIIL